MAKLIPPRLVSRPQMERGDYSTHTQHSQHSALRARVSGRYVRGSLRERVLELVWRDNAHRLDAVIRVEETVEDGDAQEGKGHEHPVAVGDVRPRASARGVGMECHTGTAEDGKEEGHRIGGSRHVVTRKERH